MNVYVKIFCLILSIVMLVAFTGCDSKTDTSSIVDSSSTVDSSSIVSSAEDQTEIKPVAEAWDGPTGYVIVVPEGNSAAKDSAEILKTYYKDACGVTLSVVTDITAEAEKEILIGKTNRKESDNSLPEAELKVSLNGSKLVFDGGHDVTVDSAVRKYIAQSPKSNEAITFKAVTDFVSTLDNGYKYVWGDEFEGVGLNLNKWSDEHSKMGGRDVLVVESTPQTTAVADGALRLTAYKAEDGSYHVPSSVHTKGTMNYQYGYVEIKARLSIEEGSFASFWTRSISDIGGVIDGKLKDYYAEVDMFEILNKNGMQAAAGNIAKVSKNPSKNKNWYASDMTNAQTRYITNDKFHIIGYEWTPTEIKLYYDGELYARFDITSDWVNGPEKGKGKEDWTVSHYFSNKSKYASYFDNTGSGMDCFHEAQYLIFNHHLHISVNTETGVKGFLASKSVTLNHSFSSADFVIDYCRIYQKEGQNLYTK